MLCIPESSSTIVRPDTAQMTRTQMSPVAAGPFTNQAVWPSVMCSALRTWFTAPLPGCASSTRRKLSVLSPIT